VGEDTLLELNWRPDERRAVEQTQASCQRRGHASGRFARLQKQRGTGRDTGEPNSPVA
jgi:hypothetical protein